MFPFKTKALGWELGVVMENLLGRLSQILSSNKKDYWFPES